MKSLTPKEAANLPVGTVAAIYDSETGNLGTVGARGKDGLWRFTGHDIPLHNDVIVSYADSSEFDLVLMEAK